VAQSFAGWAENTAGSLAESIEPSRMGLDLPEGVMDLSGLDVATGDFFDQVFTSLNEGGGDGGGFGGGGGGCACACACAGCACACAGGGR